MEDINTTTNIKNWISNVLRRITKGIDFSDQLIDEGFDLLLELEKNEMKEECVPVFRGMERKETFMVPRSTYDEMQGFILTGRKIPAIKILCNITDWGLKDSKDSVESSVNFRQPISNLSKYY